MKTQMGRQSGVGAAASYYHDQKTIKISSVLVWKVPTNNSFLVSFGTFQVKTGKIWNSFVRDTNDSCLTWRNIICFVNQSFPPLAWNGSISIFYHIPISNLLHTWSFIPNFILDQGSISAQGTRTHYFNCLVPTSWSPSLVTPRIWVWPLKKDCRSNNKQLSIGSFLDWKGHHWVSTRSLIPTHTFSLDSLTKFIMPIHFFIFLSNFKNLII